MKRRNGFVAWAAVGLMVVAVAGAAVNERDQVRLERLRQAHGQELERAAAAYAQAVARANGNLDRGYRSVIRLYERNSPEAAAELEAQLQQLGEAATATVPTSAAGASASQGGGHQKLIQAIGDTVVDANGRAHATAGLGQAEYVLLYFSAAWCGPCRAFTPNLVAFQQQYGGSGRFHVLLVSSDRSEQAMFDYMKDANMPWGAVPFNRIGPSQLRQSYGGRGIPNLVIVDRNGRVISGSYVEGNYVGPNKVLNDMRQLLN
jgi:thiol-disulfide isomerase/thioredoxin